MRFYQATEKDYEKIVQWFNEQRRKGATCVDRFGKAKTVEELKRFVEARQGFQIFVCEDDKGEIRVVAGRERRGGKWNPEEPEMTVKGFEAIDYNDYLRNDFTHRIALWKWIIRDNIRRGIKTSELYVPEKAIPLAEKLLGNAFSILRLREDRAGKTYYIRIDLSKEMPFLLETSDCPESP